jgi:hypothetical protein
MINWNCDGSGPHADGEVRIYPLGAGGNLILCCNCFRRENQYRLIRRQDYWADDPRAEENWPTVDWNTAEVYVLEGK